MKIKSLNRPPKKRSERVGGRAKSTSTPKSVSGFRAIKPTNLAHAIVLEDLARRIDDE